MTERFLRVTAVIGALAVPLTSCSSEREGKHADRDSIRAEVMTLVEQSPEHRQANVCEAMARNDRFDGPDDPHRTACATGPELNAPPPLAKYLWTQLSNRSYKCFPIHRCAIPSSRVRRRLKVAS